MAFNVSEFRSAALPLDGARPNLFDVQLTFPGNIALDSTFTVKSAAIPGSSIGATTVNYFGREVKFAGNRTFSDWTVTILNDEDFQLRTAFENWMSLINSHAGNLRNAAFGSPTTYTSDAFVTQYSKTGLPIQVYNFVGMFPIDLSPIDMDWGSNDTIEEFQVTFAYQYWTNVNSTDFA
jgi:hypothetical protein